MKDLLKIEDMEQDTAVVDSVKQSGMPGEKPLLIPDFVSKPKGVPDDEEDLINFNSSGQAHLVLRSRSKLRLDQITLPMWVSANARILQKLLDSETDPNMKLSLVKTYLDYTAQVGDLCQSYATQSVVLLDDAHRREQAQGNKLWNDISMHSMFYHLEKKQPQNKESSRMKQRNQRATDSTGREICINYNNPAGCRFPNCRYAHVCLATGCKAAHPVTNHPQRVGQDEVGPRFRQQ